MNKKLLTPILFIIGIVLVAAVLWFFMIRALAQPKYTILQNVCENKTTLISYQNFTTPYGYPDGSNLVIRSDSLNDTNINVSWSYMSCIASCEPINGTATIDVQPYWEGGIKDEIFQQLWDNKTFPVYGDIEYMKSEDPYNSQTMIYSYLKIEDLQKYGKYETKQVCNLKEVDNFTIQWYLGGGDNICVCSVLVAPYEAIKSCEAENNCTVPIEKYNGYVPMQNPVYSKNLTEDELKNLVGNQICSQINSSAWTCGDYEVIKR